MSHADTPIHLRQFSICKIQQYSADQVIVPVCISQSELDGLHALIQFNNGLEASGKGQVPGSHELTMFYRKLRESIRTAEDLAKAEKK